MDTVPVTALVVTMVIMTMTPSIVRTELTSEFVSHTPQHHLLLTCSTSDATSGTDVISIAINNATTSRGGSGPGEPLAWMKSDGVPQFNQRGFSGQEPAVSRGGPRLFVSGVIHKGERKKSLLQVLVLNHDASRTSTFTCKITVHGHQANIEYQEYRTQVQVHVEDDDRHKPLTGEASLPPAAKMTTRSPEPSDEPSVRTGTVIHPTVVEAGIPMSVVIAMLVLITLLFVVTFALLLQKFKEKCTAHPVPYPNPYCLTGDGMEGWGDGRGGMGALKGSRPSLHTMVGLRSHYSLPRPLQPPPPPPPKLCRSKSRESGEYAGGDPRTLTRSFHYTTPYDAIVHDEDGELSLLNTSAHCDVTPALPPEQACEPTYKVPRSEAEVQTQGQGHSMYARMPSSPGPSFELE